MKRRLQVVFLWHMHQPSYEDPRSGLQMLPWTWLHGVKDYLEMGEIQRQVPEMRTVTNFTPSLLEALQRYLSEDPLPDRTLRLMLRDPDVLSDADRQFLIRTCFAVNQEVWFQRLPRYRELHELRNGSPTLGPVLHRFGAQEMVDLEVLFLLSWCGPTLQEDPRVAAIAARQRGFRQEDLETLVAVGQEQIRRIVPAWKELRDMGRVELSTTPFHHPILPLLFSTQAALEARPETELPSARFQAPEEAARQLDEGLRYFTEVFGQRPRGLWPAEGAVSQQAVDLIASRGLSWICTDEEILRRSLGGTWTASDRLRPHVWSGTSIFFRDHFLSDQIGFVYSRWPQEQAIRHFLQELRQRAEAWKDPRAVVVIALDGENAWEHYPCGGYPFLTALYRAICDSGFAEPVTFSEYLERHGPGRPLEQLATGSWIDGTLNTWIGDPVKNRAWCYLAEALEVVRQVGPLPAEKEHRVRRLLMRAEASDWFWWFGEGHSSIHEPEFDFLFRENLRALYQEMGLPPPEALDRPVGPERVVMPIQPPTALIHPEINGRKGGFFKWVGAGTASFQHGSIHRLDPRISMVRFGYDHRNFYLRVEGFHGSGLLEPGQWARVRFRRPVEATLEVTRQQDGCQGTFQSPGRETPEGIRIAVEETMEAALPLSFFQDSRPGPLTVEFFVEMGQGSLPEERFPWEGSVVIQVDPVGLALSSWSA